MNKIDVEKISEKEKLTIEKGLLDYKYIMDNWQNNDKDFQDVYYDFYLKARATMRGNSNVKIAYFKLLHKANLENDLFTIIEELGTTSNEFSLCSKLLHTRYPNNPIYDRKVREYLINAEKIGLWWGDGGKGAPRKTSEIDKIKHDWDIICDWYKKFLVSENGLNWVAWFDRCFPKYSGISNYKKVDFIIFAIR